MDFLSFADVYLLHECIFLLFLNYYVQESFVCNSNLLPALVNELRSCDVNYGLRLFCQYLTF